jgi:beta-glucosidase
MSGYHYLQNYKPWMNKNLTPEERAKALLQKMLLSEKIDMLHGIDGRYVGNVRENKRLGIPAINMNDGPQGFRADEFPGTTTAFPSAMTVAASFDLDAMYKYGAAMGQEFWNKGSNCQLGPGMNTARVDVNGRNFEYAAGEDPFLGYKMVQPLIKGI